MKRWICFRRISQAFFSLLFVYILWSTTYPLTGFFHPETFFKINPLIMFITSISERVILPGIIFSVLMILLTFIFGRFFCGWVCPLGTTIDIIGAIRGKFCSLKDVTNKKLRLLKFFILSIVTFFSLIGIQVAWVFDPIVIISRFVSLNFIPTIIVGVDNFFIFIIKKFELYGQVYDFYRTLKSSILGINVYYFSNSGIILLFFLLIIGSALFLKRFWCRAICPLGGIYALIGRFSLLNRVTDGCINCKKCKSNCRMGAIKDDLSYIKGECIFCMDCIYDCPQRITRFTWPAFKNKGKEENYKQLSNGEGLTRRSFLLMVLTLSLYSLGFKNMKRKGGYNLRRNVIRPPAALKEDKFLDRCIRCGNCMKVCVTNGLQPVLFQAGLSGIWTPQLVPEKGYCEYYCTLCGNVCPTGAIPRLTLEEKKIVRLGLAKISQSICIPWSKKEDCIVCEEHCPIPDKAIKLKEEKIGNRILLRPYVDESLCVGCGICQNKCPVLPVRAIRVDPIYAYRPRSLNKSEK